MSALVFATCLISCSKDPDVPIYDEVDLPKCLRPVSFKCQVDFLEIKISCKAFPDAEAYELEAYTIDFLALPEGEDPSEEYLVHKARITGDQMPYTFEGPEEVNCHIRMRAVNDTDGRLPSEWVTGKVKTGVDPSVRCSTPSDFKVEENFNWITCTVSHKSNVKSYEIEVYSEPVPSSGEPNADALLTKGTVLPTDFPLEYKGIDEGTYYYRIRACNEEDNLEPSKWHRGSFKTTNYWWREIEGTFDYGLSNNRSRETKFNQTEITNLLPSKATGTGTFNWDGVTYGPNTNFGDDKWSFNRCKVWDKTSYAVPFPLEAYEMIKITQPGTLSFIPRIQDGATKPEIILGIRATKGTVTTFEYIYKEIFEPVSTGKKDEANRITIEVTEDYVYGITEAAELYLYADLATLIVYPLKWTRKN